MVLHYSIVVIMGTPSHQHLFDFSPVLEYELVLELPRVIRACN